VVDMLAMVLYLLRTVGLPGYGAGGAVAYNKRRGYGSTVYRPPLHGAAEHVHGCPGFVTPRATELMLWKARRRQPEFWTASFSQEFPTLANSPVREAEDICRRCRRSCYLTGLLSPEKLAHGRDIVRLGHTKPDAAGSRFS
jgi:hypothetical protein